MKERCKNCSVYETKKCKCWSCEDDCKGITSTNNDAPQCKNGNMPTMKKDIFADLINGLTYLNDSEIHYLVHYANKELGKRQMRASINNKKTIEKKQLENEQG